MRTFAASKGRWVASLGVAAAMTAAAWVGSAPPASAHGACRYTGDRVSGLTASARVSCATARRVAAAYDAAVMGEGSFPDGSRVPAAGFSCRTKPVGSESEESFTVRCARGGNIVRFAWGV